MLTPSTRDVVAFCDSYLRLASASLPLLDALETWLMR